MRADLNRNGKVAINLGVVKFDLGGDAERLSDAELHRTATQLLSSEDVLSAEQLLELQREAVSGKVYEQRFVVLEGELALQMSARRHIDLMLGHVADYLGLDATPRASRRNMTKRDLERISKPVEAMFKSAGSTDEAHSRWYSDLDNLERMRLGGQELVRYS